MVYCSSIVTGADLNACCGFPRGLGTGENGEGSGSTLCDNKSSSFDAEVSFAYVALTSLEANLACSKVSATTRAIGWPLNTILSEYNGRNGGALPGTIASASFGSL